MKSFTPLGAKHFVREFRASKDADDIDVLKYLQQKYHRAKILNEGTPEFAELRDCMLRDADRCIYLSASFFVRSLDLLRPSSSSLSVMGLYYSSFYAATSIMAMMGCWLRYRNRWVEVVDANPGAQRLQYKMQDYPGPSGSHKIFWKAYYSSTAQLQNWLPREAGLAIRPISGQSSWFIDLRNKVNYQPFDAFHLIAEFERKYDESDIPECFPGELNTAYKVAKSFLYALLEMTRYTGLQTDIYTNNFLRALEIELAVINPHPRALSDFARTEYDAIVF